MIIIPNKRDSDVKKRLSDVRKRHSDLRKRHSDVRKRHSDVRNRHSDGRKRHSDIRKKHLDVRKSHSDKLGLIITGNNKPKYKGSLTLGASAPKFAAPSIVYIHKLRSSIVH